jgi:hypothetical protein
MAEPDSKATTPKRDPAALSSEYHKARKQLMLWAGILFIWELIGVDLHQAIATGGNIGAIVNSLKSPEAVPWALLILVGYFVFKLHVEWRQCSETRRQVREARMDYYSAWIVSIAAIALYFGQKISSAQFADLLRRPRVITFSLFGIVLGFAIAWAISALRKPFRIPSKFANSPYMRNAVILSGLVTGLVPILVTLVVLVIIWRWREPTSWAWAALGATVSILLSALFSASPGSYLRQWKERFASRFFLRE